MLIKETSEEVELELSLPFEGAVEAVARALCLAARATDISAHGEGENFARLEIAVPSGFAKLNPAYVVADVTGAGDRSHVSLRATAREGLIFQATARKLWTRPGATCLFVSLKRLSGTSRPLCPVFFVACGVDRFRTGASRERCPRPGGREDREERRP